MARMILRVELLIDVENGRATISRVQRVAREQPIDGVAPVAPVDVTNPPIFQDATPPPEEPNVAAPTRQEARILQQLLGLGLDQDYITDILKVHSMDRLGKLAAWVQRVAATQGCSSKASLFKTCLSRSGGK